MDKKAEYQLSSSMNDGILEVVVTGNATGSNFQKMIKEVDAIIEANRAKKAIFDIRDLKGRIDMTEIYRFVRNHHPLIYDIQSVMVDLPENAPYETATKNAGVSLMWFNDMDNARKWFK